MGWNKIEEILTDIEPVLSAAADAVCILDENGETIYSNAAYQKMVKRGNTELVGDGRDICKDGQTVGKIVVYHDISEVNRLKKELDRLHQKLRKVETGYSFKDIIGNDPAMQQVINTAKVAAMTPATIMLRGESGTGKEIFASAIHNTSPRQQEAFVKINCSSLPEELLESELFGYKEGAFTGARRGGKKGLFQEADKGTLFLDEVGDVSPRMQVKLLRVLQEKEIMPVGSVETIPVDVRIICATNKPLEKMIEEGTFREDLYYRLNVFPLHIPPLRKRKGDIGLISAYLLNRYSEFYEREITGIEEDAVALLCENDWQGNVRELENVLSRALINLPKDVKRLAREDIRMALEGQEGRPTYAREKADDFGQLPEKISEAVAMTERYCISKALAKYKGDKNKAAAELDLPLRTLYYKCRKLGIK